jgi:hypothetical protein
MVPLLRCGGSVTLTVHSRKSGNASMGATGASLPPDAAPLSSSSRATIGAMSKTAASDTWRGAQRARQRQQRATPSAQSKWQRRHPRPMIRPSRGGWSGARISSSRAPASLWPGSQRRSGRCSLVARSAGRLQRHSRGRSEQGRCRWAVSCGRRLNFVVWPTNFRFYVVQKVL